LSLLLLTRCITVEAKLTDPKWGTHGFLKTADGVSLHYVEKGDRAKPMILFVHGFPEFWYQWHEQIEAFGADGKYHVVAFDMRGYNDSDKPEGVDNYSTEKLNEDVRQVILKLGPSSKKAYVVAHDWGGVVATAFAHQYPDNVDKLIIFNTAYGPAYLKTMITNPIQLAESLYVFLFQMTHIAEAVLYNNDSAVLNLLFDKIMPKKEVEIYKFGTTICFCIKFLNVFCFCFFCSAAKARRNHCLAQLLPLPLQEPPVGPRVRQARQGAHVPPLGHGRHLPEQVRVRGLPPLLGQHRDQVRARVLALDRPREPRRDHQVYHRLDRRENVNVCTDK